MIAEVKTLDDIESSLSVLIWITRFLHQAFSGDPDHWENSYVDDVNPLTGAAFILDDITDTLKAIQKQWLDYYFERAGKARKAPAGDCG